MRKAVEARGAERPYAAIDQRRSAVAQTHPHTAAHDLRAERAHPVTLVEEGPASAQVEFPVMPGAREHRFAWFCDDMAVLEANSARDRAAADRRALVWAAVMDSKRLVADPDDADPEPIDFDDAHAALSETFKRPNIDGLRPFRH